MDCERTRDLRQTLNIFGEIETTANELFPSPNFREPHFRQPSQHL